MNIDRLDQIATWLEAGAPPKDGVDGFDMGVFHAFGACCIAGTAFLWWGDPSSWQEWLDVAYSAQELLGLTYNQAHALFYGPSNANPQWAARCIRGLIATGNVDWYQNKDAA